MAAVDDAFLALRQAMQNLHQAKNQRDNLVQQLAVATDTVNNRQTVVDQAWEAVNALL